MSFSSYTGLRNLAMPIYEYACERCGHAFETLQKMSDDPLVDCPTCSEPALRRLVSAAAFQLKGTGWYATDFKGRASTAKKEEGAPSCPTGTCPASSD
jgi:putative FmdB family regulatory protein